MLTRVLSLDISASSTGWSFYSGKDADILFGLITTSPKCSRAERLVKYRGELFKLLNNLQPTYIVMEDVFAGLNSKTLVLLAKFAGVTEECCLSGFETEPYIIHNSTVKSFFKVRKKEEIFDIIVDIFDIEDNSFSFKKSNDITDSLAMLLCYLQQILGITEFRIEKNYGYLYEV
jgi:Holliday junction resolvasome RuvABC endonuclease subunit